MKKMKQLFRNKVSFYLLFLLFSAGIGAQSPYIAEKDWRQDRQKVKIISYNIFDGFDSDKDKDRKKQFVEWVKEQSPDVLALQELCGFNEDKLKQLAAMYGHNYVAIVKNEGYPVGITSKSPIQIVGREIDGYGHGLLHCKILDMDFLVTHLNPSDWKKRKKEADNIIQYISRKKLDKCLLMGDLNSHSPFDASVHESHYLLLKNMMESDLQQQDDQRNLNDTNPEYSVISTFLAASLHDVCRIFVPETKRHTFPTRILVTTPKGEILQQYQERLDYIFVSNSLRSQCVDARIYNDPDTDYLSDHYPIGISMLISKPVY